MSQGCTECGWISPNFTHNSTSCTAHTQTWKNEWAKKQRNIMWRFRPTYWNPHATGLHISYEVDTCPDTVSRRKAVEVASAAHIMPPGIPFIRRTTAGAPQVVVAVLSTKCHPIGDPPVFCWLIHRISGVSTVSAHRQPILIGLVIDVERRILSRVPVTVRTLNLHYHTPARHTRIMWRAVSGVDMS